MNVVIHVCMMLLMKKYVVKIIAANGLGVRDVQQNVAILQNFVRSDVNENFK
jgi:hypothetical protein